MDIGRIEARGIYRRMIHHLNEIAAIRIKRVLSDLLRLTVHNLNAILRFAKGDRLDARYTAHRHCGQEARLKLLEKRVVIQALISVLTLHANPHDEALRVEVRVDHIDRIAELLIEHVSHIIHCNIAIEHGLAIELQTKHPLAERSSGLGVSLCGARTLREFTLLKQLVECDQIAILWNDRVRVLRIVVETNSRHNVTQHCQLQILRHLTRLLLALSELRLEEDAE